MPEACRLMMVLAMTDVVTARRRRNLMAETTVDVVIALPGGGSDVVQLTDGGYGGSDVVQLTDGGCGGREDEEFHDDETARSR